MDNKTDVARAESEGRALYEMLRPYRVSVPRGERGPWTIAPFDTKLDVHYLWQARDGRAPGIGVHTRLIHEHYGVVMSDSAPEIFDLLQYTDKLTGRILVSGLGLGMVLHILTQVERYSGNVESITVLEKDGDVVELVAAHYRALDKRIEIINADIFEWQPPNGARWDSAWHDIWPDIAPHNLPDMDRLRSKYERHVAGGRQFFWGEKETREKQDWDEHVA